MRLLPIAGLSFVLVALAQSTDAWLTYHGDYTGQRHSRLAQITPDNVGQLKRVWRFETRLGPSIKASPILKDGVLYITTPDNLWAVDAHRPGEVALSTPHQ